MRSHVRRRAQRWDLRRAGFSPRRSATPCGTSPEGAGISRSGTQPRRETLFAYVVTVAIHEGWRLTRADREQCPLLLEHERDDGERALHQIVSRTPVEDQVLARETLREIAEALPARKRTVIALQALGYSYREIGELLDYSYSTLNRQLDRAHRCLDALREPIWG